MNKSVPIKSLVVDDTLYPRQHWSEYHIADLARSLEAGIKLPALIVASPDKRGKHIIIDGTHRYKALVRMEAQAASVEIRKYKDRVEMFKDAVALNASHGLRLGSYDKMKVLAIGESLGIKETELADLLRTSLTHLRALKPRFATVEEAKQGVKELRQVPLKASHRHLSGTTVTQEQVEAMESAPGVSYLLLTRQLIGALKHGLLPEQADHKVLWDELDVLQQLIVDVLNNKKAA